MNQTQKGAWFSLAMGLFCVALYIWLFIQLFVVRSMPESHFFMWPLLVMVLLTGVGIIAIRKKQSPQEIEKDERDKLIEKRAVIAAFISVWILLFAATMIPRFIFGLDGTIPVWSLAFINVGILFVVLLIYSVAVLVQYGRKEKNHE